MKKKNSTLIKSFYLSNFILLIFYLFPGSLLGYILYENIHIQPQITKNFIVSSNHFYAFIILSTIGVFAYSKTKKLNILIKYLFLLSIILESLHIIIPNRSFEWIDLFGNISGIVVIIIIYKIKKIYV
tara:strand:- start:267 stop:650 length:384 start_codon:yes stop_codon:yes gene_type:complete